MQLSVYELDDLAEKVRKRTGGDPLGMLAYANRTDSLRGLLASIGLDDLLSDDNSSPQVATTVVVLGDSETSVGKLRSIAAHEGLDPEDIEFCLEYERLKHYDFAKFRDRDAFRAVFFGPGPHSTPGTGESSSAVSEMQSHPDIYPPVYAIREESGKLKITTNSFRKAIREMLAS